MERASLWWDYVSGATRYLHDTISARMKYRVLLVEETPYLESYFQMYEEALMQSDSSLLIEKGYADEWKEGEDPGAAIMNRYVPQADYHPMDGSRAAYIARNQLLAGRVLIIRQVEERQDWLDFAVEYAKYCPMSGGLIVLTYRGSNPLTSARKGISVYKWNTYISKYDMQLFASNCVADQPGLSDAERQYITQIASRLTGTDPELCEALSNRELMVCPLELCRRLSDVYDTAKQWIEDPQLVDSVVWEAQIHVVFPIIERMRKLYIKTYYGSFLTVLPQMDEFGKELDIPEAMELRHMWYYYFKMNGFRSKDDQHTFNLLYKARNSLAHLDVLSYDDVLEILKLNVY